jgi:signal transduction histidine kinase
MVESTPLRPASTADYNLMLLAPVARYVRDVHGEGTFRRILAEADVCVAEFDGKNRWISSAAFEKILASVRKLVESEEAFKDACSYKLAENYGPLRMVLLAATPATVLNQACKTLHMVCRIGKQEVVWNDRTHLHMRITVADGEPFSRENCLARQASCRALPTLWGLPVAQVREEACIARGDARCELHFTWFDQRRWIPIVAGTCLGALLFGVLQRYFHFDIGLILGAFAGGAGGYGYEIRRAAQVNLKLSEETVTAFRLLAADEIAARRELVELTNRQRQWTRLMEQQVAERTTTLERIVEGLDGLQQSRVSTLRGFSHDLRNPLFVVRGNTQFLREHFKDGDEGEALRDMDAAATQIEEMLSKLMEVATAESGFVKLAPQPVAIAPLAATLHRRLKALIHGRDIKVSVFHTREAPDEIVIDPLVFDRVVDNILTNAAKYTDRGSILLEISGTPSPVGRGAAAANDDPVDSGFLTLKLSDTGQGIAASQVERIFRPRPADEAATRANSYGIGLSSVVRLLAQIGGRLDVMSKPGVGTTFWAHFPVKPPQQMRALVEDNLESMITRVVTIRKVEGM